MAAELGQDLPTPQEMARLIDRLNGAVASAAGTKARVADLDEAFKAVWARLKKLEEEPRQLPGVNLDVPAEEEEQEEPPRDWLAVDDVETARQWLKDLTEWIAGPYRYLPKAYELPPCWPWHHTIVQELLAIHRSRTAAYEAGGGPVSDFLTRWWPSTLARLEEELGGHCTGPAKRGGEIRPGVHQEGGKRFAVDPGMVDHLAAWWVES